MDLDPYQPVGVQQESNQTTLLLQPMIDVESTPEKPTGLTWEIQMKRWLAEAFKSQLTNAGYSIVNADPIYDIYYKLHNSDDGKIGLNITVKHGEKEIFNRAYSSRRPVEIRLYELFYMKGRINKIFRRAFQDIFSQFIEDLKAEAVQKDHEA